MFAIKEAMISCHRQGRGNPDIPAGVTIVDRRPGTDIIAGGRKTLLTGRRLFDSHIHGHLPAADPNMR